MIFFCYKFETKRYSLSYTIFFFIFHKGNKWFYANFSLIYLFLYFLNSQQHFIYLHGLSWAIIYFLWSYFCAFHSILTRFLLYYFLKEHWYSSYFANQWREHFSRGGNVRTKDLSTLFIIVWYLFHFKSELFSCLDLLSQVDSSSP